MTGFFCRLYGDKYDDLVIACQNNGTHNDLTAVIYYGCSDGICEKYRDEIPAPNATGIVCGDFNGDGKHELAFICAGKLRIFYHEEKGISSHTYKDFDINAVTIDAVDADEDGFCDLYVKCPDGTYEIFWGDKEMSFSCSLKIYSASAEKKFEEGTTEGRKAVYNGARSVALSQKVSLFYLFLIMRECLFILVGADRSKSHGVPSKKRGLCGGQGICLATGKRR